MSDGINPFPGYPHIGPGNTILERSMNKLDDIAREHDIVYAIAVEQGQIEAADKVFIEELSKYKAATLGEWLIKHVSKTAILTKYYIERYIVPIYPRLDYRYQERVYDTVFHEIKTRRKLYKGHKFEAYFILNTLYQDAQTRRSAQ